MRILFLIACLCFCWIAANTTYAVADTSGSVLHSGDFMAQVVNWFGLAFGSILAGYSTLAIIKIRNYFGIKTTEAQKSVLQEMAVNAVNSAALKIEGSLKDNPKLDIDVKDAVAEQAIEYVLAHGAPYIKALGLDPNSGDAVEAIRARVATALNSDQTPTVTTTSVTPSS